MPKLPIRILIFALSLCALFKAQTAPALQTDEQEIRQDIWRVELRGSVARVNANEQTFQRLKYFRWENNRWQLSDAETFFDTQRPDIPLIVFAPGYSLTTLETTRIGLSLVKSFDPSKSCRVVFWDWYSDRAASRIRPDIRAKIPIADNSANQLALFLKELQPQSKVCLFGFSFGCRIVSKSAETLRTSHRRPDGLRIHLVLSGAATDQHWFAQGHKHADLPEIAEKVLVTYNRHDWVLRLYPLMYHLGCRPKALGQAGLPMQNIAPAYRDRFENIDVEPYIGNQHQTLQHVRSPVFQSRINTYFFFE